MSLTFSELLQYLSNYILMVTCCFMGAFIKEAYSSLKNKSKIKIKEIILGSILGGFASVCIYRVLTSHYGKIIELEIYLAIGVGIGFLTGPALEIITNKGIVKRVIRKMLEKTLGDAGKSISEALKEEEEEKNKKKEEKKKKEKQTEKE